VRDDDVMILRGPEVEELLAGREAEIIDAIRRAYLAYARGDGSLPHSTFLRFSDNRRDRIIALPAYLGDEWEVAGVKWISSFPHNLERGLDRASAIIILNSSLTGRPEAVIEGSIISAKRTAASAALAAQSLQISGRVDRAGMIGCGLINMETARFLRVVFPSLNHFIIYDLNAARAERFKEKCGQMFGDAEVEMAEDMQTVLASASVISLATTATEPYIDDLSAVAPGTVILHISLRDLSPQVILSCDNVVDDIDHVCRAQTSVHLTEQLVGNRDFIRCSLADILNGKAGARNEATTKTVFSPFGLGVLDIAVSKLALDWGLQRGEGMTIPSFFPKPFA
jgi:2,3-diaminopropionate biosynthesis protein SbnB